MRWLLAIAIVCGVAGSTSADDFIVIVNAKHPAKELEKKVVADAFLKKRTLWGDNTAILPVDQKKSSAIRAQFTRRILERSPASVRTYWNQLIFSGRGVPPPELESDAAIVAYVARHRGAIGYVSATAKLEGVKSVVVR
jgi:ABC-type phosphate transport system substrate-binding protein